MVKKQMDKVKTAVAITLLKEGWTQKSVAEKFGVSVLTILRLKKAAADLKDDEYSPKQKEGSGPSKKLTLLQMKKLKKAITRHPFMSARQC